MLTHVDFTSNQSTRSIQTAISGQDVNEALQRELELLKAENAALKEKIAYLRADQLQSDKIIHR